MKPLRLFACLLASAVLAVAQSAEALAGKRVLVLGDSITQGGTYVSFMDYFLQKSRPELRFELYPLGLSSETLSGLSEAGHAGGKFPRPCLFERLGRALEKVKPEIVFACYGINDGIYQPLDEARFKAFRDGVTKLLDQCQAAGVKQVFLATPPIYDFTAKAGEFDYDAVMTAYAAWEMQLKRPGLTVIDLHTAMRKARDARAEIFSRDRIHPGDDGHLLMARTILAGAGVATPEVTAKEAMADPLFKAVDQLRKLRAARWMAYVGYTREKVVAPTPLGDAEEQVAKLQAKVDELRRAK
jgi:lysophospholipase L1-like esterase